MRKIFSFIAIFVLLTTAFLVGCGQKTLKISWYYDGILAEEVVYQDPSEVTYPIINDNEFIKWFIDSSYETEFDINTVEQMFDLGEVSIYGKSLDDIEFNIFGLVDGQVLLNPTISWSNPESDPTFNITLYKGDTVVLQSEARAVKYNFASLEYGTEYKLVVEGSYSNHRGEISFMTINDNDYKLINEFTLPSTISTGCVLQRDEVIEISGTGPSMKVISLTFGEEEYQTISDENGNFEFSVPSHPASFDPITITLKCGNVYKNILNVLIGDVYLFAGQSNMQWPIKDSDCLDTDFSLAKDNDIRFFAQDVVESGKELDYCTNSHWFSEPEKNSTYSAIAFMSAALLSKYLASDGVPIGILAAYQGNTNISNWISNEFYVGSHDSKALHFNGMVSPLRHAKIKAVVWYQGENNSAAASSYKQHLLELFACYRDLFNNDTLPFYVLGLACYDGDNGNNYDFSYVREAQAEACREDDNAYFISTCDDGDPTYIHPYKKHYICERICKSMLSTLYGRTYLSEGPEYLSHEVVGNKMIISFTNSKGLYASGKITNIYLAGEDGKYYEANAVIENEKLVVTSSKVPSPVYCKYGFGKSPFVNIFNANEYSMVPFRTDEYNLNIDLFDYNNLAAYTFHPDGSKMQIKFENSGLNVLKENDGKTYGSVRLNKWGQISKDPLGFSFTVIGTNSGARIIFRCIEGPQNEVWGFDFVDDFTGSRTFDLTISDFRLMLNKYDSKFDPDCISYIELVIEAAKEASITVTEARFVNIERTKPRSFDINSASVEDDVVVTLNKSAFANNYRVLISSDKDFNNIIFDKTQEDLVFKFDKSSLDVSTPYYIKAISTNELGETIASNSGFVFYLNDVNSMIINNFDFATQEALDAYIQSSMDVHADLSVALIEDGKVKITSKGGSWQQFIFKIDAGSNDGYSKLKFKADFNEYPGTVNIQLNVNWTCYSYNLDLSSQKDGEFVIDLSDFILNGKKFNNEPVMWVMFNFASWNGSGYIIFDDVSFAK